jgi:hypothetical protein
MAAEVSAFEMLHAVSDFFLLRKTPFYCQGKPIGNDADLQRMPLPELASMFDNRKDDRQGSISTQREGSQTTPTGSIELPRGDYRKKTVHNGHVSRL